MNKIVKYEITDDGKGLKAYFEDGKWFHVHSNELSKLEEWVRLVLEGIERDYMCYSILRRLICNRHKKKPYTRREIVSIASEIEGENLEKLKEIHKKYLY